MFQNLKLDRPLAIIDLETTGTNPQTDRIVEISVLKVQPDGEKKHRTRRLNPGIPIPPEASAIHGISDRDVADKPVFSDLAQGLVTFLDGCDLCGFNLKRFDLRVLYAEFRRAGVPFELDNRAILDPMEIFHAYEKRDLAAAVEFYLGREHADSHSAKGDVLATAEILDAMLDRYTDLPAQVAELHQHFKDPTEVDSNGFFTRVGDTIRFKQGKYRGQPIDVVARDNPDYFRWMLNQDFFDDTKAIARRALNGSTC